MRSVAVAIAIGLVVTALAIAAVLTRSPLTVVGTNAVPTPLNVELAKGSVSTCQPSGTLPQGTSAIRIAIEARAVGPKVNLRVLSGSHVVTEGQETSGWGPAPAVTVPIKRLAHTTKGTRTCISLGPLVEPIRFRGRARMSHIAKARLQAVTLHVEYLRPGSKSWWSLSSSIAYHMGLGHAASGTWIVFLLLALMLTTTGLASWLTLKELR
jgi:hypothetical protein